MTPALVPRIDDDGTIGTPSKRWSAGYFAGRLQSRSQTIPLKYFVSDQPTRYNMSGMPTGTRPEDGDIVFQYLPPGLFLVTDQTNLGNNSGYFSIASVDDLASKIDTLSGVGTGVSLNYTDITLTPTGSGLSFSSLAATGSVFRIEGSGNLYLDQLTSGKVLVLSDFNQIVTSPVTTGELASLQNVSGNIQNQINNLVTGAFPSPGGLNLSIQFNDGGLFGGDINFKFNKSGAFGYSPSGLRGIFDIYKPSGTGGPNLYMDYLSNLYLSGQMLINGNRVLTTKDLISGTTGTVFYDDTYVVKTTGVQTISGQKNFYNETIFNSGIGIQTSSLRGPLDIGTVSGSANAPSNLSITKTAGFQYQLWDTTGTLTFEVYGYITSGEYTFYSNGISGNLALTGSNDWFKVDLAWTGAAGVSGYKVVFGGDTTNNRFRDYYLTTTGTGLAYGLSGQTPIHENPIIVSSSASTLVNFYINPSGDLHTTNDIYARKVFANNSNVSPNRAIAMCLAYTPSITGADSAEIPIPYDTDGITSVTWNINRFTLRVQTAGGAASVALQKSTGTGVFSPTTLGTVIVTSGAYEGFTTSGLGTLSSSDKIRFNVLSISGTQNWTVLTEISR